LRLQNLILVSSLVAFALLVPGQADAGRRRAAHEAIGSQTYTSPQSNPIAACPEKNLVFVASTTSNRVDVIDTTSNTNIGNVPVGMEPVGLAIKPDGVGGCGDELWVSNHVSDSVSVIDIVPASASYLQVVETVQSIDPITRATTFDEPVGIAFAEDGSKAYVALSSRDQVAVVSTSSYSVTSTLDIPAQDPRALVVRNGRLFVFPFESNNQSEFSACQVLVVLGGQPGDQCTIGLSGLVDFLTDPNLSGNVRNIVIDPDVADRDLFVFRTSDDTLLEAVDGLGTLLYGAAVDASGNVLVTQTEARNADNGDEGMNLIDLDNRMFLNQVTRVDCSGGDGNPCGSPTRFDLEPVPPVQPLRANALATPFGAALTDDGSTLVATAAGTSRVFTLNASTGAVLDIQDVGAIPFGVALISTGATGTAYVLNTLDNTVSVVAVGASGALAAPSATIPVGNDPTPEPVRLGRIAFNNALASDTGTFSCGSCHPFGHTDQLLWRVGGGTATVDDEIRSTMPIRGLRDTVPLHWDGVPGDPFGGGNGAIGSGGSAPANCNLADQHTCFVNLTEGALSGVMCDQTGACPAGGSQLDADDRSDMASFMESVSYPPARMRAPDDVLTGNAVNGFRDFFMDRGSNVGGSPSTCADSDAGCHELPLGTATNSETLAGFDAPTMRGMTDRFLQFSIGVTAPEEIQTLANNFLDFTGLGLPFAFDGLTALGIPFDPARGMTEITTFGTAFIAFQAVYNVLPLDMFQMFEEASTGHSGALGRQATLNTTTAAGCPACDLETILDELEAADSRGVVNLRGQGLSGGAPVTMSFQSNGVYRVGGIVMSRSAMLAQVQSGALLGTLTAHLRSNVSSNTPQPLITPEDSACGTGTGNGNQNVGDPKAPFGKSFTLEAKHVDADDLLVVDGVPVPSGSITLMGGSPGCTTAVTDQRIDVDFSSHSLSNGLHLLQVQNVSVAGIGGLLSPEIPFCIGTADQCNP
jgi:YVTN family beta-propeller protein